MIDMLKSLVLEHGRDVLQERGRVLGLMADRHPLRKREQRLLKVAYEAGVVEELLRDGGEHTRLRVMRKLVDEYVVDADGANEVVGVICQVLGHSISGSLKLQESEIQPNKQRGNVSEIPKTPAPSSISDAQSTVQTDPKLRFQSPHQGVQKPHQIIDGRFQDNGDGTVTDMKTGLQWMRCFVGQNWIEGQAEGSYKIYSWQEADTVTKTYRFAGYTDWRMPTPDEFYTLTEKTGSPVNSKAFPVSSKQVWSNLCYWGAIDRDQSLCHEMDIYPWIMDLEFGTCNGNCVKITLPILLVRSKIKTPIVIADRYQVPDKLGTIIDTKTGLQWMRFALGETIKGSIVEGEANVYTWKEAIEAAKTCNFAGYKDWRVPTVDELKSLFNQGDIGFINEIAFPKGHAYLSWSSTPCGFLSPLSAYHFDFTWGYCTQQPKNNKNKLSPVRLVRNK